jgi:hypothetical protein
MTDLLKRFTRSRRVSACLILSALWAMGCASDEGSGGADTTNGASTSDASGADTSGASGADTSGASDSDSAGGGDTSGGTPCGDITEEGTCEGDTLRFCRDGALLTFDCRAGYFEAELFGEVTGTCQLINDSYGYDCVVATGDTCVGAQSHGDHSDYFPVLCAGQRQGCVAAAEDQFVCKADVGACEAGAVEPFCLGDVLVLECAQSQPIGFDCVAMGGKCEVHEGEAVCGDLPQGAACHIHDHDHEEPDPGHEHNHGGFEPITECAEGLTCDPVTETCQAPPPPSP